MVIGTEKHVYHEKASIYKANPQTRSSRHLFLFSVFNNHVTAHILLI